MNPDRSAQLVKARALDLGFSAVGVTDLSPTPHGKHLRTWLSQGMAGNMRYMHRQLRHRLTPASILAGASRAVVLTRNYYNPDPPQPIGTGRVAKYARGRDYHMTLKEPLQSLARYMKSLGNEATIAKTYVDAGPVPERELAQRAGLGWIGKNTMLIHPSRGSFCFIAVVLTDLQLAVDPPFEADRCGRCRRCIDACPTGAIREDRLLDSRRCISYLTIEHKAEIEPALRNRIGTWVFGCDICQDVCPWNRKFAAHVQDRVLALEPDRAYEDLATVSGITDDRFNRLYGATPLKRASAEGMRRNATIAIENLGKITPWPKHPTP